MPVTGQIGPVRLRGWPDTESAEERLGHHGSAMEARSEGSSISIMGVMAVLALIAVDCAAMRWFCDLWNRSILLILSLLPLVNALPIGMWVCVSGLVLSDGVTASWSNPRPSVGPPGLPMPVFVRCRQPWIWRGPISASPSPRSIRSPGGWDWPTWRCSGDSIVLPL